MWMPEDEDLRQKGTGHRWMRTTIDKEGGKVRGPLARDEFHDSSLDFKLLVIEEHMWIYYCCDSSF